jgi:hypothetical protein
MPRPENGVITPDISYSGSDEVTAEVRKPAFKLIGFTGCLEEICFVFLGLRKVVELRQPTVTT